jgi:hypothetical protein
VRGEMSEEKLKVKEIKWNNHKLRIDLLYSRYLNVV